MAKLEMKRISVYALKKDNAKILDLLQRASVIEVRDHFEEDDVFQRTDMSTHQAQFEKDRNACEQALEALNAYAPEKKGLFASLEGKEAVSVEEFSSLTDSRLETMNGAHKIIALSKQIAETKAAKVKPLNQIEALVPWMNFDIAMDFKGTEKTTAFTGYYPEEYTTDTLAAKIKEARPELDFYLEIISASKQMTCVFLLCLNEDSSEMEDALRMTGFTRNTILLDKKPVEAKEELLIQAEEMDREILALQEELVTYTDRRKQLQHMADYCAANAEKFGVLGRLVHSKSTFVISGYVPAKHTDALINALNDKFDVYVEVEEADGDDVPVLLQNNAFSSPAEGVLESYSLPGKGEIDPTSIMSVFYYVFFGLMLADAFYGAIMFFVCFILTKKYKNMSPGLYKNLKLFMFCGISTCFWGIMFGGYFGDVVTVIAKVFFNTDFTIPAVWFVPLNDPMRMLMFSFVLGLIHLFIGLGIKGYQLIKNSGIKDFIYDVIFWFALLIGLIIMLLPSEIFASIAGSPINIPAVIVKIGQGLAIIGALGIIITNGRSSRNWGKRLMKGAYELYGISGWLSDVLSYSRLMALGLASGVIASVFNQMGSMGGSSIFGAIVFVIVFLVGHALNLGINLLGSYVHTNRLQFVEFFGKFYEGGGEAFKPFASNTKYIQVKEETK